MKVSELSQFHTLCTGCQACVQVCPMAAITMQYSEDGFLYPEIHEKICIQCGLCAKCCPIAAEHREVHPQQVLSVQALDPRILSACSSGGLFKLLASEVIDSGGAAFGAFFDPETKQICHGSTDEMPLEKLLRSKYVQSNIGSAYDHVGKALMNGRRVLFCGTPCQVRGLYSYLAQKRISGELLTLDFKCHGVPSPLFFKEALELLEEKENSRIVEFTFREKDLGWKTQILKAYFQDGHVWKHPSLSHYLFYFFLKNYTLRDSCYQCTEYHTHCSDITLADDWVSQSSKDDRGTSLVFANTRRGRDAIDEIRPYIHIDDLSNQVPDMNIYSHQNYNHSNKARWLQAWNTKGIKYVSGIYFYKTIVPAAIKWIFLKFASFGKRCVKKLLPSPNRFCKEL